MYTMLDAAYEMFYGEPQAEFAFGRNRKKKARRKAMAIGGGILGVAALGGGGLLAARRMGRKPSNPGAYSMVGKPRSGGSKGTYRQGPAFVVEGSKGRGLPGAHINQRALPPARRG